MIKNFTKLMLTAILLVAGVGGVKATKTYADLSRYGDKWNSGTSTLTMTWTSQYGNQIRPTGNPILPTGDLSEYTLYVNTTSITAAPDYRILVYTGNGQGTITVRETGLKSFKLSEVKDCDVTNVSEIVLSGSSSGKTDENAEYAAAAITQLYIEKPFSLDFSEEGIAEINITDMVATGGLSFDDKTGALTTDGTEGDLKVTFSSPVDLSYMTNFTVNQSGDGSIIYWTNFVKDDNTYVHNSSSWYSSKFNLSFNSDQAGRATDVKSIVLHSAAISKRNDIDDGNGGTRQETDDEYSTRVAGISLTISGMTITSRVLSAGPGGERRIETLQHKYYDNGTWKTNSVTYSYGKDIGNVVGDGSATQDDYIDISGYNELRIYASSGEPRIFLVKEADINATTDGYILTKDGVKQNGQFGGVQDTAHKLVKNGGYYYISVDDIKSACNGQAKLIGIKAEYGQTVTVSKVTVIEDSDVDYSISGSGVAIASTMSALADATATSIDATGLTNTSAIELTSANPNCLFIANSGKLSNTSNVIVSGNCAQLALTDGYPFKAPVDFTAESASYTTTINAEAQAGTLCLPFAATIPAEGVTAYTLAYANGDEATATLVETTIPANTPVLLNGSGSQTFTGSSVAITAGAAKTSEAMTGVYESTTAPLNSFVLQKQDDNVGFFKVASNDITVSPFRAYMTAQTQGARLKIVYPGEITAVKKIAATKCKEGVVYNLNGQRITKATKGLYLMNGKKYVK